MSVPGDGEAAADAPLVLHVDDEEGIVDLAATFLEREGLSVLTATDAESGLSLLEEHDVDAVVSDYDMPRVDGLEFLAEVREDHPDLPFVLFTGKGSEEIASEAISRGVTDYLQKETGTDQYAVLANRIEGAVRRYRAEQNLAEARRRYETLLANLPGMVYRCTTDEGWPMSFVSEGSRSLTGHDPAALTGDAVDWETDVIVAEDREPVRRAVTEALQTGDPFEVTYRITRPDGERRTVWEQGRAVDEAAAADDLAATDDRDVIEGFITDVTAKERNERALRTVSATQRAVLQRVTDGVVLIDTESGEITETNAAAATLTGHDEVGLAEMDADALLASADVTLADLVSRETFERRITIAGADDEPITLAAYGCTLRFEEHRRLVLVLSEE